MKCVLVCAYLAAGASFFLLARVVFAFVLRRARFLAAAMMCGLLCLSERIGPRINLRQEQ